MKLIDWIDRKPLAVGLGQRRAGAVRLAVTTDTEGLDLAPGFGPAVALPVAAQNAAGVMSAADKTKLDGLTNTTQHRRHG